MGGCLIETYILYTACYKSLSPHELRHSWPAVVVPSPLMGELGPDQQQCRLEPHPSSAFPLTGDSFHLTALPVFGLGAEGP